MLHIKPAAAPAEHRDEPTKIFIPDTLARWPWPRRINPHYATVAKDSTAWIKSFGALSPKAQHAFDRCNFSKSSRPRARTCVLSACFVDLLTGLAYPRANKGE